MDTEQSYIVKCESSGYGSVVHRSRAKQKITELKTKTEEHDESENQQSKVAVDQSRRDD